MLAGLGRLSCCFEMHMIGRCVDDGVNAVICQNLFKRAEILAFIGVCKGCPLVC